jgi:peptidoglycan/LPS O-acetylase OafA/YrhL
MDLAATRLVALLGSFAWVLPGPKCRAEFLAPRFIGIEVLGCGRSPGMHESVDIESLRRAFREQRYFASLDGLRTISIVPVVWHHATPRPYSGLLGRGPIGVDLFFAISGFLITTLLVRERLRLGRIDLVAFYARRSVRIFPLYYLVLGLHLGFALFVRPDWEPSRNFLVRWPYYATYTANWLRVADQAGSALFVFAWSLCTEEQFYAFWAPVLRWCRRLTIAAVIMGLWLLVDILLECGCSGTQRFRSSWLFTVVTSFASPIGFGALLALAIHDEKIGYWLWFLLGRRMSSPVIGAVVLSLVVYPWAKPPILHLGLALLVLCCSLRRDHGLSRLLDNAPMRFVGRISYGIYLWHVPVIGAIRTLMPDLREHASAVFACALPLSLALAAVSYRTFEQPVMKLGKGFRRG